MSLNFAVIYRPYDDPEQPLIWFPLEASLADQGFRNALQGGFDSFQQHLAQKAGTAGDLPINLYLFLADELVSFHQVDVPEGVKRNLNKLLPVLMEEQLAQDIEQVAVHYVEQAVGDEDAVVSNAAAWDRDSFQSLIQQLKNPAEAGRAGNIRIKACLPVSACEGLSDLSAAEPRPEFWQQIPRVPVADQLQLSVSEAPDQLALRLEGHRWNLVTPEQNEISPLFGVFAVGLLAAGLYLLNQWLSVF
ncbi:type II secretion system protein GspL [Oceanospirillum sanctuarii]|uniref:type II secretion system protein GspL n=1 Tax=Oceanospirillum sanctuarii TaxID=1434821 RepID=UPI000A3D3E0F|nr:type II secretion system protein GspL [Oceanospirillum sanctuarii]